MRVRETAKRAVVGEKSRSAEDKGDEGTEHEICWSRRRARRARRMRSGLC